MKLLYYIFELPMILFAVWVVSSVDAAENMTFSLWINDSEISANPRFVLIVSFLFGYIWSKINSWFAYMPMRRDLRLQKKTNKALNKEQEKLNETVSGLKQNIQGLQEKTKELQKTQTAETTVAGNQIKGWITKVKAVFAPKKGN
jgi:hypothetical protein